MAAKFKFLLLYFLSWVIFFDLMRLIFLVYHSGKASSLSVSTWLLTFWYGLRMDASVAAYITLPVCLFVLLSLFIHFFRRLLIYRIYTFFVLLLVAIISLCDLEIYSAWGFRIDITPLRFLSTPREAFASVSHLPLVFILVVFLVCYGLFIFCFRFILKRIFFQQQNRLRVVTAFLLLVFTAALIIPIRGGFQLAPLNQSSVYFSTNNFANHAAINASWNFLHSVFSKGRSGKNPYLYLPEATAVRIVDSLYAKGGPSEAVVNFPAGSPTNVIVIIWESFTEKAIHISKEGVEVTPQFNKWRQEGLFFSNCYASGDRTNKGVPAVLSGYPAMPNTTVIHTPGKSAKLTVLSQLFKDRGYATPFFYGGEPEFANMKSYLLHGGFDPIVGKNDFPSSAMNSKWGAHDGIVMNRVLGDLNKIRKPFFATWLTLSSHEPFETPVPVVFPGSDIPSKFLNSLHYTDQVIGDFITQCSRQSWWNNTIMIIIGDHGHPLPETGKKSDDFRTPMLWIGGALAKKGMVIDKPVSQLDIAASLAGQAGLPTANFPFSKDLFSPGMLPWAFFSFNDGFGFVDSTGRLVFDNVGKLPVERQGSPGDAETRAGQAMMQRVYGDFLKK
ncbi:MAG TPA: sulfatase-like hydrolase/transferase [Chitinophagaceae bacterium]|nr:sulfatase-like hydrolase/transferase [Chitinophagaceae bacterium]